MKHFQILFSRFFITVCLILGALVVTPASTWAQAIKVEVVKQDGKYQLLRDGKTYRVNGAGLANGDLKTFAAHGGNSIRTWSTVDGPEGTSKLLDEAHELGITVSLCVYTALERHGFDYYDEAAVAQQFERIKQEILKYQDHPALLTWIIGNELNFDYKNPMVYDAVNSISKMIHQVDPNHPTTTAVVGFNENLLEVLDERASDLDFISFQVYGQLYDLPRFVKDMKFKDPYFSQSGVQSVTGRFLKPVGEPPWNRIALPRQTPICGATRRLFCRLSTRPSEITFFCGAKNRKKHQHGTAYLPKPVRKLKSSMFCITYGPVTGLTIAPQG